MTVSNASIMKHACLVETSIKKNEKKVKSAHSPLFLLE